MVGYGAREKGARLTHPTMQTNQPRAMWRAKPHMDRMNNAPPDAIQDNPLLEDWSGAFGVPPFARIAPRHFMPAFARAFADHSREVAAIAANGAPPTFANTIEALESAGQALTRVSDVFDLIASADTNDDIQEIEREIAPLEAQHWNRILLDEALFARVDRIYRARGELALTPEQARVLQRYHVMFTRAGAALDSAAKARLAAINERL